MIHASVAGALRWPALMCSLLLLGLGLSTSAAANSLPKISGTPPTTWKSGLWYNFKPTASDPDGNPIKFSIQNKPAWAWFSTATGQLAGTPTRAQIGTYSNIVIKVSDGTLSTALPAFSITVLASGNHAPKISGTAPASGKAGLWYNFKPTASDPDGDPIKFSIQNKPAWLWFSTATGQLAGTPTSANIGTYSNIVIKVSDGTLTTALPALSITVAAAGNHAPKISGTAPASGKAGLWYNFKPTASDPDGDPIKLSIQNKPAWMWFSTATGQLAGTPTSVDVGTYSNIIIKVSDGKSITSLPAFSITVVDVASGAASLEWMPPTQNTDGSTLTNLAGYRIVYGVSATQLTQTIQLANAGLSAYVVENLAPGTYYFAVRAYTSSGAESADSNVIAKLVR